MAGRKKECSSGVPSTAPTAERAPTAAEESLLSGYRADIGRRVKAPQLKVQHKPPAPVSVEVQHDREDVGAVAMMRAFGTTEPAFADTLLKQLLNAACEGSNRKPIHPTELNGFLAAMHAAAPRDEIEAMLLAQMVATHAAAMVQLRRLKGAETIPQLESNGSLANRLLRTYAAQVETLQRYRGKGQQKMTVEHVHVHSGGQAIVGTVNGGGPGGEVKSEEQPHAKG